MAGDRSRVSALRALLGQTGPPQAAAVTAHVRHAVPARRACRRAGRRARRCPGARSTAGSVPRNCRCGSARASPIVRTFSTSRQSSRPDTVSRSRGGPAPERAAGPGPRSTVAPRPPRRRARGGQAPGRPGDGGASTGRAGRAATRRSGTLGPSCELELSRFRLSALTDSWRTLSTRKYPTGYFGISDECRTACRAPSGVFRPLKRPPAPHVP